MGQIRLHNGSGRRVTDGEPVRLMPGRPTSFVIAGYGDFGIFGSVSGTIETGQIGPINIINTISWDKLLDIPDSIVYDDELVSTLQDYQPLSDILTLLATLRRIGGENSYTQFDENGHPTLIGDARAWRDEVGDAIGLKTSGAGIAVNLAECTQEFAFNATYNATPALADFFYKNVQLNHDKDLATSIHPHVHWFQEKNYTPNFLLEYRWQKNGGAKETSWTKLKMTTLEHTYVSGTIHQKAKTESVIAVPAGTALSDIVQFRIYRDTTNVSTLFDGADPYNTGGNASVGVLSFDCHLRINSPGGSINEN